MIDKIHDEDKKKTSNYLRHTMSLIKKADISFYLFQMHLPLDDRNSDYDKLIEYELHHMEQLLKKYEDTLFSTSSRPKTIEITTTNCCYNCAHCDVQLVRAFAGSTIRKYLCTKHYRKVHLDSCCKSYVRDIHREEDSE